MDTQEIRAAITAGARHIADLEQQLTEAREQQDARIVAARNAGAPWNELVAADGRSRQMLNRVFRAATE